MSSKKLSKNIIIYGLSNGLRSLVPFIMLPILTSYISADGVGLLGLIETSILFLSPFILLNVEAGINVEFFKSSKTELSKYLTNGLLLSFCAFVIVFILSYFTQDFISFTLEIPNNIILLLPIFVLLRVIPTITLVLFQAQQKPVNYLFYSLSQTIFDFALSAAFIVIWEHGYLGRLEGTYYGFFAASLIGIFIIYRMGYFEFTISKKEMKKVLDFGLPLIPHAVGAAMLAMSDRYFISFFEGNSYLGYYIVAYQIGALMLLFSRSVNQAWSPMMYQLLKNRDFSKVNQITMILFGVFSLVGFLVYLSSNLLFDLFIDPSFFEAKAYFLPLLIGFVFQSLYMLYTNFIFYSKRTKILALITVSTTLLNLALNYVLILEYGVVGVAYATAITWFVYFAATFLVAQLKVYPLIKSKFLE